MRVDNSERESRIRAIIAKYKELRNLTDSDIAQRLSCTVETYKSRLKHPFKFTLGDMIALDKVFRMTTTDRASLVRDVTGSELRELLLS